MQPKRQSGSSVGAFARFTDISTDNFFKKDVKSGDRAAKFKTKIVYPNSAFKATKFADMYQREPLDQ